MPPSLFLQNVIAVMWDFDNTMIPGSMQQPIFDHYGVDARLFWREVNSLPAFYRAHGSQLVAPDSLYLNHILTYVRAGVFAGLNNDFLRKLGAGIPFYPGLPGFLDRMREVVREEPYAGYDIQLEHYIISTGLRQMIDGSAIGPHVDGIWACEFVEEVPPPGYLGAQSPLSEGPSQLTELAYVIDNTTKTRAVFEINKGSNKAPIDVNDRVALEDRRVPFNNMVYIADGPSDIPVFSILNQYGGRTLAVYRKGSEEEFRQVKRLREQGRVEGYAEANYEGDSQAAMWIKASVLEIADRIIADRGKALRERVGKRPSHITD